MMEKGEFTFDPNQLEQQKTVDLVANTNNTLFITGKGGYWQNHFCEKDPKGNQQKISGSCTHRYSSI